MGSWWRTMRIRQTKLPPFAVRCVSCQEPHRFSQNLESQSQPRRFYHAQLGKPLCHRGTTDYPPRRAGYGCHGCVVGRLCQTPWRFAETPYNSRHLAFGIFQTIPTESSPQTISPGGRYRGRSPHQPPVMDGHGNWSAPDSNQTNN
jgi:hypothetical protein